MKFRFQWEQEAGGCDHKERADTRNMPIVKFSVVYAVRLKGQSVMQ